MSQTSIPDRQKLTAASHVALKNKPRKFFIPATIAKALSKQRTLSKVGRGEIEVFTYLLQKELHPIQQLAVYVYNIDIALWPIAIEIHDTSSDPDRRPYFRKRIEYLLNSGWNVLYIKTWKAKPVRTTALEYIISFFNELRFNKTGRCQYRMINSAGKLLSSGGLEGEHLTAIHTSKK
jgi:hypothetical protein